MSLKPTFYDFALTDGSVVQVTRNFAGLYMLKAYDPALYEKSQAYNRKNKASNTDDLENAGVIYAAYVTATLVNNSIKKSAGTPEDPIMEEIEFFSLMPSDVYVIGNILKKLFGDEKKKRIPGSISQSNSSESRKKDKGPGIPT